MEDIRDCSQLGLLKKEQNRLQQQIFMSNMIMASRQQALAFTKNKGSPVYCRSYDRVLNLPRKSSTCLTTLQPWAQVSYTTNMVVVDVHGLVVVVVVDVGILVVVLASLLLALPRLIVLAPMRYLLPKTGPLLQLLLEQ
jgi:hypothetical protein